MVVSSPILLEYEEVVTRYSDAGRWQSVARVLDLVSLLHDTVLKVSPQFRFRTIVEDQDDDSFADAAISSMADFVITHDRHFRTLAGMGYRPQPISPEDFIRHHLLAG